MRHRIAGKLLSRNTEQRKSLFKNLLSSLFEHGYIETTEAKAKAIKSIADKLVSRAQQGTLPAKHLLQRFFGTRKIVNKLVEEVAPAMGERRSGFTRIIRLGKRKGDDSMMVKMELVAKPVKKEVIVPVETKTVKPKKEAKVASKKEEATQ